ADVPFSLTNASLWSGLTPVANLSSLESVPPSGYKAIGFAPKLDKAGPIFATYDSQSVVGAGPMSDQSGVVFAWLGRDGAPLVLEQAVYTTSAATVVNARAAPFNTVDKLVAWVERDPSMVYSVRAQILLCTGSP